MKERQKTVGLPICTIDHQGFITVVQLAYNYCQKFWHPRMVGWCLAKSKIIKHLPSFGDFSTWDMLLC